MQDQGRSPRRQTPHGAATCSPEAHAETHAGSEQGSPTGIVRGLATGLPLFAFQRVGEASATRNAHRNSRRQGQLHARHFERLLVASEARKSMLQSDLSLSFLSLLPVCALFVLPANCKRLCVCWCSKCCMHALCPKQCFCFTSWTHGSVGLDFCWAQHGKFLLLQSMLNSRWQFFAYPLVSWYRCEITYVFASM